MDGPTSSSAVHCHLHLSSPSVGGSGIHPRLPCRKPECVPPTWFSQRPPRLLPCSACTYVPSSPCLLTWKGEARRSDTSGFSLGPLPSFPGALSLTTGLVYRAEKPACLVLGFSHPRLAIEAQAKEARDPPGAGSEGR